MIFTASNILSFLRGPLALLFISDNVVYRGLAIFLAMITDYLDGYLARKNKTTSAFGAFLDPLMDKFFVIFALSIFIYEGRLQIWEALCLVSRDFAVLFFGLFLVTRGLWTNFAFRSIWAGKISTTLQFFVLLALTFHFFISPYTYACFIILGVVAFLELFRMGQKEHLF